MDLKEPTDREVYYDPRGHLTLAGQPRNWKFCRICGKKTQAHAAMLNRHYHGHHPGKKAEYLAIGQRPLDCMYDNWDIWLRDDDEELVEKPEYRKRLTGNPRVRLQDQ
jgi:hypothetical protein